MAGDIAVSFRLRRRPRVRPAGRYSAGPAQIEVDSVELMPFAAITPPDVRRSGERDRGSLRERAATPARSPTTRCSTGWSSTSSGDRRGEHRYRRERRSPGASALPGRHDVPATLASAGADHQAPEPPGGHLNSRSVAAARGYGNNIRRSDRPGTRRQRCSAWAFGSDPSLPPANTQAQDAMSIEGPAPRSPLIDRALSVGRVP